jgi:hypothetical protein
MDGHAVREMAAAGAGDRAANRRIACELRRVAGEEIERAEDLLTATTMTEISSAMLRERARESVLLSRSTMIERIVRHGVQMRGPNRA